MEVAVYDTRVARKDGGTMHFDVIVPRELTHGKALEYGRRYLQRKGQAAQPLTHKECEFCHIEEASAEVAHAVRLAGYHIHEMEGCE